MPISMKSALAGLSFLAFAAMAWQWASAQSAEQPVWTDKPQHVDRQSQPFERIPVATTAAAPAEKVDEYPLKLDGRLGYRVLDSVSFIQDGKRFRLANLRPVPSTRTCKGEDGVRWACGLRSRAAFSALISGKSLRCKPLNESAGYEQVECMYDDKDLAKGLVLDGNALTEVGSDRYAAEQKQAMDSKTGFWADPSVR